MRDGPMLYAFLCDSRGRPQIEKLDVPGGTIYLVYDEPGGKVVSSEFVPQSAVEPTSSLIKVLLAEIEVAWAWRSSCSFLDFEKWAKCHEDTVKFLVNERRLK